LELADGDFLDLDWVIAGNGHELRDDLPLVLLLHGLEGSANSGYARQVYRELTARGFQPVGLNFRGCSGEPNRLPRAYHSGETEDLAYVVAVLRERYPGRALGAVGVSLGGNVLLKYLGEVGREREGWSTAVSALTDEERKKEKETNAVGSAANPGLPGWVEGKEGKETVDRRDRRESGTAGWEGRQEGQGIDAAAAISVPYDLSAGADHIERGFSKTYRAFLVRKLQRKVRAKEHILRSEIDFVGALGAGSFREFDQAVIVPIHGFEDAEDYYRSSSSAQFLRSITVPTLLIHSLDDPFLPPDCVPEGAPETNPNIHTGFTRSGGHVGFVSGAPWAPVFWGERRAAQFLAEKLRGAN